MRRYVTFDIERFLKDAKSGQWDKDIAKLKEDKEKILFLKAQGNSEVHSGNISKTTEQYALDLAEIDEKINATNDYWFLLDMSIGLLSMEEQILIRGFYFPEKMISAFVDEFCINNNCETRTVYNRKRQAVEHLRRIIEETLEEDSK